MKIDRTATIAVASALALTTSGLAVAQTSVPVTTAVGEGTRVLEVTDLAGEELTGLALVPGRPSAFRVAVRDTAATVPDPGFILEGYDVESSLTDLYATTDGGATYDYSEKIPSEEVTLGSAASPLDIDDALAHLDPDYLLSAGAVDCDAIAGALEVNVLTLATNPLCLLLGTLTGDSLAITDVPLAGTPIEDIDLSSLTPDALPLVPTAGEDAGSTYDLPDCVNGAGAGDTTGCTGTRTTGTELTMLAARPATAFLTDLTDILDPLVPTQLASLDGTGAIASLQDVLDALHAQSADHSSFANELASSFTTTEQLEIVNDLMTATAGTLGVDDLGGFGLLASGFPTLTVDPVTATDGTYAGTLTVRLVECPACTP